MSSSAPSSAFHLLSRRNRRNQRKRSSRSRAATPMAVPSATSSASSVASSSSSTSKSPAVDRGTIMLPVMTPSGSFGITCSAAVYEPIKIALQGLTRAVTHVFVELLRSSDKLAFDGPEKNAKWEPAPKLHSRGGAPTALFIPNRDTFPDTDIDIFCEIVPSGRWHASIATIKQETHDMYQLMKSMMGLINYRQFFDVTFVCEPERSRYGKLHLSFTMDDNVRQYKVDLTFDDGLPREIPCKHDVRLNCNGVITTTTNGLLSIGKLIRGEPHPIPEYLGNFEGDRDALRHENGMIRCFLRAIRQIEKGHDETMGYGRGGLDRFRKDPTWTCTVHRRPHSSTDESVLDLTQWRITTSCCSGDLCCMCAIATFRSRLSCPMCSNPFRLIENQPESSADCVALARDLFGPRMTTFLRFERKATQRLESNLVSISRAIGRPLAPSTLDAQFRYELVDACNNMNQIDIVVNDPVCPLRETNLSVKFKANINSTIARVIEAISGIICMILDANDARRASSWFSLFGMPIQDLLRDTHSDINDLYLLYHGSNCDAANLCFATPRATNGTEFLGETQTFCGNTWIFKNGSFNVHLLQDLSVARDGPRLALLYAVTPLQCSLQLDVHVTPNYLTFNKKILLAPHGAASLSHFIRHPANHLPTVPPCITNQIDRALHVSDTYGLTTQFCLLLSHIKHVSYDKIIRAGSTDSSGTRRFCLGCGGDDTTLPDPASTSIDDQLRWCLLCLGCKCENNCRWHCMWCILNYSKRTTGRPIICEWCRSLTNFNQHDEIVMSHDATLRELSTLFGPCTSPPKRDSPVPHLGDTTLCAVMTSRWSLVDRPPVTQPAQVVQAAPAELDPFDPAIVPDVPVPPPVAASAAAPRVAFRQEPHDSDSDSDVRPPDNDSDDGDHSSDSD